MTSHPARYDIPTRQTQPPSRRQQRLDPLQPLHSLINPIQPPRPLLVLFLQHDNLFLKLGPRPPLRRNHLVGLLKQRRAQILNLVLHIHNLLLRLFPQMRLPRQRRLELRNVVLGHRRRGQRFRGKRALQEGEAAGGAAGERMRRRRRPGYLGARRRRRGSAGERAAAALLDGGVGPRRAVLSS